MHTEVTLPTGERGRVIGIYFHAQSEYPHYLVERRDAAGALYQTWQNEDELTAT